MNTESTKDSYPRNLNSSTNINHVPRFLYQNSHERASSTLYSPSRQSMTERQIPPPFERSSPHYGFHSEEAVSEYLRPQSHMSDTWEPVNSNLRASAQPIYNPPSENNHEDSSVKKKRACCCTRTGALCCGLITVVLVIGIAVAAFFLWPRIPKVEFVSITQQGNNKPISQTDFSQLFKSSSLQADVQINLKVTNLNYIDLVVNGLTVAGSLKADNLNIPKFLKGDLKKSVNLKSQATSPFALPVQLAFPSQDPLTHLLSLAQVCSSKGDISIPYTVTLSLALISWTGYKPSVSDSFTFTCPWTIPSLPDLSQLNLAR